MSRAVLTLSDEQMRARAMNWIRRAPDGTRVEFTRGDKRSTDQNDLMWALLTDVAAQVEWFGEKLSPEDWKDIFTASLRKARVVPGIEPGTVVALGLRTSKLRKDEFSQLIELIYAFGVERGVVFHEGTGQ